MRLPWRLLGLIAVVLALLGTLFTAIVGLLPGPVSLPIVVAELVGIGLAFKGVRSAHGTRTALVVMLLSLLVPLAGSVLWLAGHSRALATVGLKQFRNKALAETSGPEWTEKRMDRVVVRYQPQDPGAAEVLAVLPESVARVQAAFTAFPAEVPVFVFPDRAVAEKSFGPIGFNGGGLGDMLVLVSPAAWPAEERAVKPVDQIVTHELTHVAVFAMGGPKVPRWLNEGVAVYVAGQIRPEEQTKVAALAASGKRYSLDEINNSFTHLNSLQDVGPGFALAGSVVQFMVKQYSFAAVQRVVVELGAGRDLDGALRAAIGTDSKGLEAAWQESLVGGGGQ